MSRRTEHGAPLRGQVALVTGGARRIGRAIALELGRAGADVAFTWRSGADDAASLERELIGWGVRTLALEADLDRAEPATEVVEAVVTGLGGIHLLVNNIGRYDAAEFEHIGVGQWEAMIASNLTAPFLVSRAAVPYLRPVRGRIVQLASVGAFRAFPTHAHYCASKAGLAHLTRAMARALAPDIPVNSVAPGLIVFNPKLSPWEQHMAERTPLGRPGHPEDVAGAVRFLAECSPYLTGQMLVVDGGLSLVP